MIYTHISPDGDYGGLDDLEAVIRRTTKALREHADDFDVIAVTGVSGLLVGPTVALRLKKKLVVIRKDGDGSHAARRTHRLKHPGLRDVARTDRVLFLDDFVSSGETLRRVERELHQVDVRMSATFEYDTAKYSRRGVPYKPARFTFEDDGRIPFLTSSSLTCGTALGPSLDFLELVLLHELGDLVVLQVRAHVDAGPVGEEDSDSSACPVRDDIPGQVRYTKRLYWHGRSSLRSWLSGSSPARAVPKP